MLSKASKTMIKTVPLISEPQENTWALPLFSELEPVLLSGAGNMSSYPQDTICLPPSKQEGDPGPPSRSNNLCEGEESCKCAEIVHFSYKTEAYPPPSKSSHI